MTCSFCAIEFDGTAARKACAGCSLAGGAGCRSVCCPRCGYEMPEGPAIFARLRAWLAGPVAEAPTGTATLAAMRPGQRGTVLKLDIGDLAQARKLMALGIVPGVPVELERRRPSVVFRTGYTQLAIDDALAEKVVVDLGQPG